MAMVLRIALIGLFLNVLFAVKPRNEIWDEEDKSGPVFDPIEEVLKLQKLVEVQSKYIDSMESLESKLAKNIRDMESILAKNFKKMESNVAEKFKDMESKLDGMESSINGNIVEVEAKVQKVDSKIEVARSEVRLISQQKLTWQNSTWPGGKLISDYAVDGVYTLSKDMYGVNPIQAPANQKKNNMLIIDLGGLFKIHTVKVWNRADMTKGNKDHNLGLKIYADKDLLGTVKDYKLLYNFRTENHVFARKVYLKKTTTGYMRLREVQVFGTGPYCQDELKN